MKLVHPTFFRSAIHFVHVTFCLKTIIAIMARYLEFLQVLIDIGLGIYPVLVRIRLFSHIKIEFPVKNACTNCIKIIHAETVFAD